MVGKGINYYQAISSRKTDEFGRADQYCVDFLLARMYLNAEVYTGTARYTDCITCCNQILGGNAYSLADNYAELFMADNGEILMQIKKLFSRYWLMEVAHSLMVLEQLS